VLPLARLALARPRAVLLALALATAALLPGLFRLELRTDGAAIYPLGDPTVRRTLADRETFQETDQVILLATARTGGPLLASPAGFRFLHEIGAPLQALPGVGAAARRRRRMASRCTRSWSASPRPVPPSPSSWRASAARRRRAASSSPPTAVPPPSTSSSSGAPRAGP
jgi:hypothetical protein